MPCGSPFVHVTPFPPDDGWFDYETAFHRSVPWNGDPDNTWTFTYPVKPRVRVKAGREIVS